MRSFLTLAVLATLVVACNSGDSPTDENGDGDDAGFAARIDGQNWSATMIIGARAGELVISGTDGTRSITISLDVNSTGTYTIANSNTLEMLLGEGGELWAADGGDDVGTLTLTMLTATRAAGSFSFVGEPSVINTSTNTRTVDQGTFDVALVN